MGFEASRASKLPGLRSFQGFEAHKLFGGVSDLSHLIQVKAQFCVNKNRLFVLTTRVAETEPESSRRLTTWGQKQHRTIPLADFATGKAPMQAAKSVVRASVAVSRRLVVGAGHACSAAPNRTPIMSPINARYASRCRGSPDLRSRLILRHGQAFVCCPIDRDRGGRKHRSTDNGCCYQDKFTHFHSPG